jgi:hypothetical protein
MFPEILATVTDTERQNDMEIWKDIPGHEGQYQVSDMGRVKSIPRRVRLVASGVETTRQVSERILRPGKNTSGHVTVALGFGNSRQVHQLVLEAFIGPRPERHEVLHLNHIPDDNRLVNLKYGTRSENLRTAYAAGKRGVRAA